MREYIKKTWGVALVALSVLGGATQASAASIVIDDLSQGAQLLIVTAPGSNTSTVTGLNTANVIGGSRRLDLNVPTGSNLDSIVVNTVTNRLNFNIGAGDQGYGSTYYDANGAGLNANFLSQFGSNAANTYFKAWMAFSDLNLGFLVELSDGANVASYSTNLGAGVALVSQVFSSFTNADSTDFNSIDWIRVTMSGPQAQDASISFLEVTGEPIPEPASLLLLGTGLAFARRWMKKRA